LKSYLKTILLFFLLSAVIFPQNYLSWYDNLDDGIQSAKAEGKKVLLFFTGSDWCGWCKKLTAEVFFQQEFVDYADYHLALVRIDSPKWKYQSEEVKEYNYKLKQMFGVTGYPTVFLLDKSGKIIARTGYLEGGAGVYVKHLKSLLK
jgi:protein disulfide-isomerase